MPIPFNAATAWGGWSLLEAGPTLAPGREIAAISQGDEQLDLFVVDTGGVVRHLEWAIGWKAWSVI